MEKFNRNSGFTLSQAWYSVTDMLTNLGEGGGKTKQSENLTQPIRPKWLGTSYKASVWSGIYMTQADNLVIEFTVDKNTDGTWKHHFTCCSTIWCSY